MADEFVIAVPVRQVLEQPAAVELRMLSLYRGDAQSAAVLCIELQPVDAAGAWRKDVEPVRVLVTGEQAAALRTLILDAVVPTGSALGKSLGVAGKTVRAAGRAILAAQGAVTPTSGG